MLRGIDRPGLVRLRRGRVDVDRSEYAKAKRLRNSRAGDVLLPRAGDLFERGRAIAETRDRERVDRLVRADANQDDGDVQRPVPILPRAPAAQIVDRVQRDEEQDEEEDRDTEPEEALLAAGLRFIDRRIQELSGIEGYLVLRGQRLTASAEKTDIHMSK